MCFPQASSLAELFFVPGMPIFASKPASTAQHGAQNSLASGLNNAEDLGEGWSNDGDFAGGTDEAPWGSTLESGDLIEAPRKVAQIGINYARASKQVLPLLSQSLIPPHACSSCA